MTSNESSLEISQIQLSFHSLTAKTVQQYPSQYLGQTELKPV